MNWRVKGLVQRALGAVPGGVRANDWMQRSLGDLRNLEGVVEGKVVGDWLVLVSSLNEMGCGVQGLDYVEVGTGWMPVLPICFSLAGACSCTTVDVVPHLDSKLTFRMLAVLEPYLPRIADAAQRSLDRVRHDYLELRRAPTVEALLAQARIRYVGSGDARATDLKECSVDVVFSNNVFEHVPGDVLYDILRESRRILRTGGISIHSANCADHYAYFDRNITFLNYLSYSEREWRFWNNELQYQNRLRPQDFDELVRLAGLEVRLYRTRVREELLPALRSMHIAPEFQKYSAEQLCATSVLLGGVKAAAGAVAESDVAACVRSGGADLVQHAPAT